MPYTTEGFVILVRGKQELLAVVASRATNENATSIEIFCERAPKARAFAPTGLNPAIGFSPPEGTSTSSAASLYTQSAIFTSSAQFTNVIAHCFTNLLGLPPVGPTNWAVSPTGSGMVSIPRRTGADSATFVARPNTNQTVIIHCFRSANSAQTHVLAGSAAK